MLSNPFDFFSGTLLALLGSFVVRIIVILVLGYIAYKIGVKIIQTFLNQRLRFSKFAPNNRVTTIGKLLENIWMYFIYFILLMTILPLFGVEIGPILASAGVLGLAVGFGAQSLVKDTVNGFFILLEGQFSVDDDVILNGVEGKVTNFGLRTTTLLNKDGDIFYISNGAITQLTNKTQGREKAQEYVVDEAPFE